MRRPIVQLIVISWTLALLWGSAPLATRPAAAEEPAPAVLGPPPEPAPAEAPAGPEAAPAAPAAAPGYAAPPKVPNASTSAKSEGESYDPKVLAELEAFCAKWMGFLAQRERDNRAKIDWQAAASGVKGTFVGYSPDYECKLKEKASEKATPVATIKYLEFIYQQEGPNKEEAALTAPRIVDATEVLEIFRYAGGKWVY